MSKSKEHSMRIISQQFVGIENSRDFNELIVALEESIKRVCNSEIGVLYIFDRESRRLKILNSDINITTTLSDSIIESVWSSKRGFFDNAIMRHKKYREEIDNPLKVKLKSMLIVPIFTKDREEVVGFLSASNSLNGSKEFERYEMRLLTLLSSHAHKIIKLSKSMESEGLDIESEFSPLSDVEPTPVATPSKSKSETLLESELKIQAKRIEELERELSLKNGSITLLDEERRKSDKLYDILEFLTNEVTYLATDKHKIYLFLEIIKNSLHNKERLNLIENELNGSRFINNLAHELYNQEKMPIVLKEFNSFKLFQSIGNLYYRSFVNENISFNIFIEPELAITMVSDEAKIKSLTVHLMNNIYGFISEGGVLDLLVFLSEDKKSLNIKIKAVQFDRESNLKKIFKERRVSPSILTLDKGLGLSVSSNLTNILGGKLKLSREGENQHFFTVTIPIEVVKEKRVEFLHKKPIKIAILIDDRDKYYYQNLRRYLLSFNIPDLNVLTFNSYQKMKKMDFSHLLCFESMLSDKLDLTRFPSVTILKYGEERLPHPLLNGVEVNELRVNAYYGMALQQILFPHLPVEEIEDGMIIVKESLFQKMSKRVNRFVKS